MLEKNIKLDHRTILVTGAAGFIGANLTLELLKNVENVRIIGIDDMNAYYDVSLKEFRLGQIKELETSVSGEFSFIKGNIADKSLVSDLFDKYRPQLVVNLAAQAGVRYSIENPDAYIESNLIGFYNILEACRHSYDNDASGVGHLVYASSSSVYGSNKKFPMRRRTKWITQYRFTRRPKNPTNCWHILIQNFMESLQQGFASLLCMDPRDDRTWRILVSLTNW